LESLRTNNKVTPKHRRKELFEQLQLQFPELLREPAIREYFRSQESGDEAVASRALQWLAQELSGQIHPPTSAKDISSFVTRLVAIARVQARSLVGLHSGALEFAREHAHLVPFDPNNPLVNPESPKEVLRFLYDWRTPTAPKLRALNQAYKVLMAHQLGLIGGLRGSVRSLLKHLGPAAIEANLQKTSVRLGRVFIPWKLWPLRVHARWALFRRRLSRLLEGDELDRALLGKYFASAYTLVCGRMYHQTRPAAFLPVCTEDLQGPHLAPNPPNTNPEDDADEETETITRERPSPDPQKPNPARTISLENSEDNTNETADQTKLSPASNQKPSQGGRCVEVNTGSLRGVARATLALVVLLCSCTYKLPAIKAVPLCQQVLGKWRAQNPTSLDHHAWKQVLLAPPQASSHPSFSSTRSQYVDCTGVAFSWPTPTYSCGYSSPGVSYPATEPELDPEMFWPAPEANTGLAWLHLAQLPGGDALGPVALVESEELYIQVHAMGALRAAQYPTDVEFHQVGEQDFFVVFSTRCIREQTGDTCREEVQVLVRDGAKLFTPNFIIAGGEGQEDCQRPANFTRHVRLTVPGGLNYQLERTLSFEPPGTITIEEQLTIHHGAKQSGPVQTIRQRSPLTLVGQHLVGAKHSLLVEFAREALTPAFGPNNEF